MFVAFGLGFRTMAALRILRFALIWFGAGLGGSWGLIRRQATLATGPTPAKAVLRWPESGRPCGFRSVGPGCLTSQHAVQSRATTGSDCCELREAEQKAWSIAGDRWARRDQSSQRPESKATARAQQLGVRRYQCGERVHDSQEGRWSCDWQALRAERGLHGRGAIGDALASVAARIQSAEDFFGHEPRRSVTRWLLPLQLALTLYRNDY